MVVESPSPRRRRFGRGLEISFDLMVSLAAAEFCLTIEGGVVYIGYQTVLVPTAITDNDAQFHLITSDSGQINPHTLDLGNRVLTRDPTRFRKMRCFLGWCESAKINLGTKKVPATVKWSGGRKKGKSLQMDGFSVLAQVGTSVPLSAVLGLQTNFKYGSHQRQFTPQGNYCKLLQDTSQELAIVFDAAQRRSWLVPKLSLLLHMSHAWVLKCDDIQDDEIPYVEPHADADEIIKVLKPLGARPVHREQAHDFLFRELMLGLNTNLLKTIASTLDSGGKSFFGFEFMDVVTEPGRGASMKELELPSFRNIWLNWITSEKSWLSIVKAVDAVVVCSELGEAIIAADESIQTKTKCNTLPKDLDYLAATIPCLKRLAEREGVELNAGNPGIRIAENTLWQLKGDPFRACQHDDTIESCWERSDRVQQLKSEKHFGLLQSVRAPATLPLRGVPKSGAVVFGRWNSTT